MNKGSNVMKLGGIFVALWCAAASAATVTGSTSVGASEVACGGSTTVNMQLIGQSITTSTPTDIILVLDDSGSISSTQFSQMKTFANNLVSGLTARGLFTNGGRVGVV